MVDAKTVSGHGTYYRVIIRWEASAWKRRLRTMFDACVGWEFEHDLNAQGSIAALLLPGVSRVPSDVSWGKISP